MWGNFLEHKPCQRIVLSWSKCSCVPGFCTVVSVICCSGKFLRNLPERWFLLTKGDSAQKALRAAWMGALTSKEDPTGYQQCLPCEFSSSSLFIDSYLVLINFLKEIQIVYIIFYKSWCNQFANILTEFSVAMLTNEICLLL